MQAEVGRARNRFLQESSSNPTAPEFFVHIDAELDRSAISLSWQKFSETEPSRDGVIGLHDPKRVLLRRMGTKPVAAFVNADGLEVGRRNARGVGGGVGLDDGRAVG